MDSRENSESVVSDKPTHKRIDFLTGLADDGFDVGAMEHGLSDKWQEVKYTIKTPAKLGMNVPKGKVVTVEFYARKNLDSSKPDEHVQIKDVRFVNAEPPKVRRTKQADLGPIRKDEVEAHPFLKYPRNMPCFCGSGKKFKKCHLKEIPQVVFKHQAPQLKALLNQYLDTFKDTPQEIKDIKTAINNLEH